MIHQVRKIDPRITVQLNLNVVKINKEQVEFLVRENQTIKGLYEKAREEKQYWQDKALQLELVPRITEVGLATYLTN